MAVIEGTGVDVYYEKSDTAFADVAAVNTLAASANALANVTDLGAIEKAVNIIEFPIYGSDIASKITGLDTPGDFTMDIAFDPDDTDHADLVDSVGSKYNFTVQVGPDGDGHVFGMSGIVSSASVAAPVDGISTLSVTVALTQQIITGAATT